MGRNQQSTKRCHGHSVRRSVQWGWCLTVCLLILGFRFPIDSWGNVPIRFEILSSAEAVAVQFDVTAAFGDVTLGPPILSGLDGHFVESRNLESGAIRYVVYSRTGEALSPDGRVSAQLVDPVEPGNGMITIGGVVASDAAGEPVAATLNALPVRRSPAKVHRKGPAGISILLTADIVDPDGGINAVVFRADGNPIGTGGGVNQSVSWIPQNGGAYLLSALATDNDNGQSILDLGSIGVLGSGNVTNYSEYADIFFGPGAPLAVRGFDADPNGTGLQNGLTYLLGLNPDNPDRSALPTSEVTDAGGGQPGDRVFVFRFLVPEGIADADWIVRQSPDLAAWIPVPAEQITETVVEGGRIQVEARVPAPAGVSRLFLGLQVVPVE